MRAAARHTVTCTTEDVAQCARRALRDGGRFVLCQRPDQLVEVLCALRAAGWNPSDWPLCASDPAARLAVLVEAKKAASRPEAGTGYFDRIRRGAVRKINL